MPTIHQKINKKVEFYSWRKGKVCLQKYKQWLRSSELNNEKERLLTYRNLLSKQEDIIKHFFKET